MDHHHDFTHHHNIQHYHDIAQHHLDIAQHHHKTNQQHQPTPDHQPTEQPNTHPHQDPQYETINMNQFQFSDPITQDTDIKAQKPLSRTFWFGVFLIVTLTAVVLIAVAIR